MNELKDIFDFVGRWPPFDELEAPLLTRLCRAAEITYHPSGTVILAHNAPNNELCLVRRGAVGVWAPGGEFIEKRAEGESFGLPSLLTGRPTAFEIRADEDTLVYRFPDAIFRDVCARAPSFDHFFSAAVVDRVQQAVLDRGELAHTRLQVSDLMSSPPETATADTSIQAAASRMAERRISSLLIQFPDGQHGIVTDRDLRTRVIAKALDIRAPIGTIATREPVSIDAGASIMDAMLLMTDRDVHHLPVTRDEALAGLLSASDLFRADNQQPVFYVRNIRRKESFEEVARSALRRQELFLSLVGSEASSTAIGHIMTAITDAVTRRCIELAIVELGEPPMGWAWLSFGSQARREQTIRTDQDNGLILAAEPAADAADYFAAFSERVCNGLAAAGYVHCPGEIMAMNPRWRLSMDAWKAQFARWIDAPEPKPLMYASIFFDFRCIAGDQRLADGLSDAIFDGTAGNRIFLRFMAQNALERRPPLGFFRRFILETDGAQSEGLNLKQRGVVPIAALARVRALEEGIGVPGTLDRIETLARLKPNDASDLMNLADAFELIDRLRIESQADQLKRGLAPDNLLDPARLTALAREHLRAAFEVVRTAQKMLERRYMLG